MLSLNRIILLIAASAFMLFALPSCSNKPKMTTDELLKAASDEGLKGNWKEASSLAGRAAKQDPRNVNAIVLYALSLENSNHIELAVDEIKKAAKLAPRDFLVQYTCGRMLFAQGRFAEAMDLPLRTAYELKPDDANTIILLAECARALDIPATTSYLAVAANNQRLKTKPDAFNELGVYYYKHGDYNRALLNFMKACKIAPDNYIVNLNMAVCLDRKLEKSDKALPFYEAYVRLTARNPELEESRQKVIDRIQELKKEPASPATDTPSGD